MQLLYRPRLYSKVALLFLLSSIATVVAIAMGAALWERMIDDRLHRYRAVVNTTVELAKALEACVVASEGRLHLAFQWATAATERLGSLPLQLGRAQAA
jgi:imidazoleglycerol phosphate dehydratase HisB